MRQRETDPDDSTLAHQATPRRHAEQATEVPLRIGPEHGPMSPGDLLRLQRLAGNSGVNALLAEEGEERSPVREVVGSGGGRPLDDDVRADMEARLGHDFRDVRVHSDAKAADSARAVDAHAYTVGSDVVFQTDRYRPQSSEGRRMLAHELTHVVQQRAGPVDGTPAPGGIRVSDPSDRFEQEATATADRALAPVNPGASVQRQTAETVEENEEEEPVQALQLQRDTEPAEEEEPDEPTGP
jgi:hypothetical protein